MPVQIQGKTYVTVAERVAALHEQRNGSEIHVETWIAGEDEKSITIGAKVTTPAGTFTGHARSDKSERSIEGQSPLEVAETSAVGRALGFAGLGVVEGIATADEVKAAPKPKAEPKKQDTPEAAAMRKLRAVMGEKGMDDAALKEWLSTDSVKALAEHMVGPQDGCTMGHPHGLKDIAEGYRTITGWLESAK